MLGSSCTWVGGGPALPSFTCASEEINKGRPRAADAIGVGAARVMVEAPIRAKALRLLVTPSFGGGLTIRDFENLTGPADQPGVTVKVALACVKVPPPKHA